MISYEADSVCTGVEITFYASRRECSPRCERRETATESRDDEQSTLQSRRNRLTAQSVGHSSPSLKVQAGLTFQRVG